MEIPVEVLRELQNDMNDFSSVIAYREAVDKLIHDGAECIVIVPTREHGNTAYYEAVAKLLNHVDRDWVRKMICAK